MCALDVRPTSIVNGEGFKDFVSALNPNYHVPSHTTINKHVSLLYDEAKEALTETLEGQTVALTSDLWTSVAVQGYISLTAHYITSKEWKLQSCLLAVRLVEDRHTGVNIAKHVRELTSEFGIKSVSAICTDNAANMEVAARAADIPSVKCFAHTLQLAVTDGLKLPLISKTLAAARRVVTHFNQSLIARSALKQKQEGNPLSLIQDTPTRWNSSYFMMSRLLALRLPLYTVLYDDQITKTSDRSKLDISDAFWKIMEDIVPILEPFTEATELLGKEDQPTASAVFLLLNQLIRNDLCVSDLDTGVVKSLKDTIRSGLMKRFHVDKDGIPLESIITCPQMLAAALDPRYKSLKFVCDESRAAIRKALTDAVAPSTAIPVRIKNEPTEDETNPPPSKRRVFNYLLGDVVDLTTDDSSSADTIEKEIELYLASPITTRDSAEPLQWWQRNESSFPNLAMLAKQYLAIPATSVPSERVFSAAGRTLTKLRASLDPDNAEKLLFLNQNLRKKQETKTRSVREESSVNTATEKRSDVNDPLLPTLPEMPDFDDSVSAPRLMDA
ncbi:E3 SUMO-protein ligase ZBED1-like [Argopecten irradians]|uniref:E3 SUMO-protein ligase ZBED1-like n=1 Tax=Argopecten irradians TaxID=31199 RepID=UPI00371DD62E